MERRGLVQRDDCLDDGRGSFIVLSPAGRQAIDRAAPAHVETVRELFVDALTAEELATLAGITGKVLARLADRGDD